MSCATCGGTAAPEQQAMLYAAGDQPLNNFVDPGGSAGRTRRLGIDDLLAIFFNPPPSSGLTLPEGVPAPERWPNGFPLLLAAGIVGGVFYLGYKHEA